MIRESLAIVVFVVALLEHPASAQPSAPSIEAMLTNSLRPGLSLDQYLQQQRAEFARLDQDGDDAITQADVQLDRTRAGAEQRASTIANILQADLNGDGVVTRDEIKRMVETHLSMFSAAGHSPPGFRAHLQAEIDKFMLPDINSDGRIDGREMLTFAKERLLAGPTSTNIKISAVAGLADGRDGPVIVARYLPVVERVFRAVDANGDGMVSREEIEAFRRR
jgi:Ca2+-binding EF-hand superfamily protein